MEDTITIPRAEYERLVTIAEDAADARAIDDMRAKMASGEEELIPSEYADRLIDGENPITVYREIRGFTKSGLAERSGVHRVNLAKIESGNRKAGIETLKKLAAALGVTVDDLI